MARTQSLDYNDRRQAILDKGALLFAAGGFTRASIADLAEACQMSKSLFYHYYASKEQLLFEIMRDHTEHLAATADECVKATAPAQERLAILIERFMRIYADARAKHVVLLNELGALTPEQRREVVMLQRRILARITDLLIELQPALGVRAAIRRPVTMIVMGMINWTYTWFDPHGPMSAAHFARLATEMILGGLPAVAASAPQFVRLEANAAASA
jgi:AcrR family transcriptional regulator